MGERPRTFTRGFSGPPIAVDVLRQPEDAVRDREHRIPCSRLEYSPMRKEVISQVVSC